MLRHLLNIASVVCLALCVALLVMWARSYWWEDDFMSLYTSSCEVVGASLVGRLAVGAISGGAEPPAFRHTPVTDYSSELADLDRSWATFAGFGIPKAGTFGLHVVMFPYWCAIAVAAACGFATRPHATYRFTLRHLFIATTFLAVVLGMIA
jgi:hypothetical protein